ncbi:MAG: V-type ATP synthase subunit F [Candidatus Poribacteria bacterium]
MKIFVIGDEYTILGYKLVGIQGAIVHNSQDASDALNKALSDPEIGIILITQRIASGIRAMVDSAKLEMTTPVVLEIPDRKGPVEGRESTMDVVQRLIGIRV